MKHSRTLIALALLTIACASFADKPAPRPDRVEAHQEHRIQQGIASGALTRREAHQLQRQEARIDAIERRFQADGRYTPQERRQVAELRRDAERDLRHALHDRRVAWR